MNYPKPIVLRFSSNEEWLTERHKYIGASEIPCLFGQGFNTYYQLWAEKSGIIEPENLDDILIIAVGEELEAGFAKVIQRFTDYTMRRSQRYLVYGDESKRLATSLDYEIVTDDAGWVPAELKIMDFMSFADNYEETEDSGVYDPPIKHILQVQQQLLVTGKPYGYLFVLVGNRQMVEIRIEADPEIHELILKTVDGFWMRVTQELAPDPDVTKDLQAMLRVMTAIEDGREIHKHGEDWWESRIAAWAQANEREKAAKTIKDTIKGEFLQEVGPAIRVKCTNGGISAKNTDRWGAPRRNVVITPKKGMEF